MAFYALDKKVLTGLLVCTVLPCAVMLAVDGSFCWWVLTFIALVITFTLPLNRIAFAFDAVSVYGYWFWCREYKYCVIEELKPQYNDLKNPDIPDELLLTPGIKIRLKVFSPAARQEIFNTLKSKMTESGTSISNDFLPWLKKQKKSKAKELLVIGIITLICGAIFTTVELRWAWIAENWQTHEVLVQERGTKMVRKRKSKRTVDTVRYTYVFEDRHYKGDAILFDAEHLPSGVQPGRRWQALVDPSDPEDSYLIPNRGYRNYRWRFIFPGIINIGGLAVILTALKKFREKLFRIPPELLEYIGTFPEQELNALKKESRFRVTSASAIYTSFEILDGRYGIFPQKRFGFLQILLTVATLPFIAGAFFSPIMLIGAIYPLIFLILSFFRLEAVLDFEAGKFFCCHFFRPGKKVRESISFDDIRYLVLTTHPKMHSILLGVVCRGGELRNLCVAKNGKEEQMLKDVPKIGGLLGHLPVIID